MIYAERQCGLYATDLNWKQRSWPYINRLLN